MSPAEVETLPPGGADALRRERCRGLLAEARERTLRIVAPVHEADMNRVHDPLMSPLVWDLGHIAAYEELWACQRVGGLEPLHPELSEVYDAAETPRTARGETPYLRLDEALEYMDVVRERTLAALAASDLSGGSHRLSREGFVWEMLIQHEHQHNETMLQTLRLAEPGVYRPRSRPMPAPSDASGPEMVLVEAGPFPLGGGMERFAYDNELPQHEVSLPAFELDRTAVTNGAFREFVESGGYRRRECWSEPGWDWRCEAGVERPLYWTDDGRERIFHRVEQLADELPVMHVSWYEADAYARWRGKRLPSEAEWEKAASWEPEAGGKRRFPWGDDPPSRVRANVDQTGFRPAPVDAHSDGASAYGALGLMGDAWEWTASDFGPYPGFEAFPYREYSEVFFGSGHKVLRGGSWATRAHTIRNTLRNWDLPGRRQIHTGFRCAADA
ncbi:MAG: ergothioneine biosynthesis protein EgtB [Thermoleophilaceae bacterium]